MSTDKTTSSTTTSTTTNTPTSFESVLEELNVLSTNLKKVVAQVKLLQKQELKAARAAEKKAKSGKKSSSGPKVASGFARPTPISKALCSFMDLPPNTEVARTEVTKYLSQYIKQNCKQDEKNRKVIVPDKKLTGLLGLSKKDSLTYFNLQKFMKPHFATKSSAATTV
tara:strand:- start:131 stop:634 length:504 start_codon:yes stop_codon:yes gene_type:complete